MRRAAAAAAGALSLLLAPVASGRELYGEGDWSLELRSAAKETALASHAPDDPLLFPDRDASASLTRLRLELLGRTGPAATLAVAWEARLRAASSASGVGVGILPPEVPAPYRLRQLDWTIAQGDRWSLRHELDRAYAALHLGRAEVTVGRQAIGWGRGAVFSAVDLFAPFSPFEADREWRRGVDALRADVKLADRVSLDAVAALGESVDSSAFAARLRGYAGKLDAELLLGRRATDLVAGATASAPIGDAEVHGELAFFRAQEALAAGGELGDARLAIKALLGASYRFAVGSGLLLLGEVHHSGFGASSASEVAPLLLDPSFAARYARGDTQILGRDAAALLATMEPTPDLAISALGVVSLRDGSGIFAPSLTLTLGSSFSLLASVYVPWGRAPRELSLRSEYGATPLAALLQLRLYD